MSLAHGSSTLASVAAETRARRDEAGGVSVVPTEEWLLHCWTTLLRGTDSQQLVRVGSEEQQQCHSILQDLAIVTVRDDRSPGHESIHRTVRVLWDVCCNGTESVTSLRDSLVVEFLQALRLEAEQTADAGTNSLQRLHESLTAHLPTPLLEASGWISSASLLDKKVKLYNTQMHYKQAKYNLLAEQSEGYAKFLLLLQEYQERCESSTSRNNGRALVEITMDAILRAMGTFQLDPVRCVDLILNHMMIDTTQTASSEAELPQDAPTGTGTHLNEHWLALLQHDAIKPLLIRHLPDILLFHWWESPQQPTPITKDESRSNIYRIMVQLVQCNLLSARRMFHSLLTLSTPPSSSSSNQDDSTALTEDKSPSFLEYYTSHLYRVMHDEEQKQLKSLGRVSLTQSSTDNGKTGMGSDKTSRHKADLEALVQSPAMQFLLALLNHNVWVLPKEGFSNTASAVDTLHEQQNEHCNHTALESEEDWSRLCYLLPDSLGLAVCDLIQHRVPHQGINRPPWSNHHDRFASPVQTETDMDVEQTEEPSQSDLMEEWQLLLVELSTPLRCIIESGSVGQRPVLFTQLCRWFAAWLSMIDSSSSTNDESTMMTKSLEENSIPHHMLHLIRIFLLPSLSLFLFNPTLAHEVWAVMKHLPYSTRYEIYDTWRGKGLERAGLGDVNKPLWLSASEFQAGKNVRYALKRLSKDTIRDMSRHIAKVCHSHPLVVFTSILAQIESYDNLVQVMVDALRYVTPLGLDVLSCCILNRLSKTTKMADGTNRSRLKEDGLHVSQWLQSLEAFVGYFYKQFPSVDFQGLLGYLMTRLKDGHVMELGLLRALLKTAAGWSFADYAPAASLSYSQLLGRSGSHALTKETMSFGVVESVNEKALREIRRVLQKDDIGVCLLILLAQVRNHILFNKPKSESVAKPIKLVAYLLDTCQVTMSILLDFLSFSENDSVDSSSSPIQAYATALPSIKDLFTRYHLDVATCWMLCRPLRQIRSSYDKGNTTVSVGDRSEKHRYDWMLPAGAWENLTERMFEVFYSHSLYDILCPEEMYKSEVLRLEKDAERQTQQKQSQVIKPTEDRAKETSAKLNRDLATQKDHVSNVCQTIKSSSSFLFKTDTPSLEAMSTFLSVCVYPRCMQSPDDAMYCGHFISLLHHEKTPGFGTLTLFDLIVAVLPKTIFHLTEGEAANLSIFLLEVWKIVSRWRYDEDAYSTEVAGTSGSLMHDEDKTIEITYQAYEGLYNKWHAAIGSVAIGALRSSEYIHLRNCLIVLTRLVSEFPTRPGLANHLIKGLEPLTDEDTTIFADIRAAAAAYNQQLLRARDDGVWREESAATVEARQRQNEAAAAARQKQAEQQMEEIKKESERIGKELGPDRWRDDRRRGGRPLEPRDRKPVPGSEPSERVSHAESHSPPARPVDTRNSHVRSEFSTMASDPPRGLGDRFQRPESDRPWSESGTKRSRTASPEEGESSERVDTKRARVDPSEMDRRKDGRSGRYRGRGKR